MSTRRIKIIALIKGPVERNTVTAIEKFFEHYDRQADGDEPKYECRISTTGPEEMAELEKNFIDGVDVLVVMGIGAKLDMSDYQFDHLFAYRPGAKWLKDRRKVYVRDLIMRVNQVLINRVNERAYAEARQIISASWRRVPRRKVESEKRPV